MQVETGLYKVVIWRLMMGFLCCFGCVNCDLPVSTSLNMVVCQQNRQKKRVISVVTIWHFQFGSNLPNDRCKKKSMPNDACIHKLNPFEYFSIELCFSF